MKWFSRTEGEVAPPLQEEPEIREDRRRFGRWLAGAGAAAAAGLVTLSVRGRPAVAEAPAKEPARKPKWGMAIDLDKCTSCGSCVVACRTENNVPCAGPDERAEGTSIFWMDMLPGKPDADGLERESMPLPCMHCEDPPCVKVCPVGATYQTDEGITAQVWDRCIGCRYCMNACPYGRRYFNWGVPNWTDSYLSAINPDVATRPKGVVEKCTFCHHRIRSAQEEAKFSGEPLTDELLQRLPACAETCPTQAITFGDLNDPESTVTALSRSPRTFRLLEHLGTKPKVFYLGRDKRGKS